jgi:hypothetical protein
MTVPGDKNRGESKERQKSVSTISNIGADQTSNKEYHK